MFSRRSLIGVGLTMVAASSLSRVVVAQPVRPMLVFVGHDL